MKITKLTAILFVILSLVMVLALVGCQGGNGEETETEIETSIQDVCKHNDTFVNSRCEEVCTVCAKIMSTGVHADLAVNSRCQEVCTRCGEVFRTDVHDGESVINDACERVCIDCGKVIETDVHGDKIINANCEEICVRCGKVYSTDNHDSGMHNELCELHCIRCGELLANEDHAITTVNENCEEVCTRCGKVMATGVHAEKVVNDKLQEVCARCGLVYVECVHDEGVIENCVKSCGNCGEVLDAEAHGEKIINKKCEEVCADCGKVYQTGVHAEGVIGNDCVERCSRCKTVLETEVHAEKIITDECNEVCSRCGKVYNEGVHEERVEMYKDDRKTNIRTYYKACKRCGGDVDESSIYTIQLGKEKPEELKSATDLLNTGVGAAFNPTTISEDKSYVTISGKANDKGDVYFFPYVGDGSVTGKYMIIKYRTSAEKIGNWEFFVSAGRNVSKPVGGENFFYKPVTDGEWQVVVFDLAKLKPNHILPDSNGDYCVDYIRWDIFNNKLAADTTVDVAYVAFADSVAKLSSMNPDVESVSVIVGSNNSSYEVSPESGAATGGGNTASFSGPFHRFNFDFAQGIAAGKLAGTSTSGMTANATKLATVGGKFWVSGWAGAYSDIAKWQYSVDGGLTWNEFETSNLGNASATNRNDIFKALKSSAPGVYGDVTSIKNALVGKLSVDLSDYYGKTVSVTFAMVLENGDRIAVGRYMNVNVVDCSHYTVAEESWETVSFQQQAAQCELCGGYVYRGTNATTNGLYMFSPDNIYDKTRSWSSGTVSVLEENGMRYVRFKAGKVLGGEQTAHLYSNTQAPITNIGKFVAVLYRTNYSGAIELFANSDVASVNGPNVNFGDNGGNLNEWTLSIRQPAIKTGYDGTQLTAVRLDWFNPPKDTTVPSGSTVDIAFIGYFASQAEAYAYYDEYVAEYGESICTHRNVTRDWDPDQKKVTVTCDACGHVELKDCEHEIKTTGWNSTTSLYDTVCTICGNTTTADMLYKTEPQVISGANCITPAQKEGFVRYTVTSKGTNDNKDVYAQIFNKVLNIPTGQYAVIRYRLVNNGKNANVRSFFAGSLAGGKTGPTGGTTNDSAMDRSSNTYYGDGQWRCIIISPQAANLAFVANADGTYTYRYLRFGFDPAAFDGSCYMDIDEIAFADCAEAAELYARNNSDAVDFIVNFDKTRNYLNGSTFLSGSGLQTTSVATIDMSQYGILDTPTSLKLGGWLCTAGGVAAYGYRVVKVDGDAVANPTLVDWSDSMSDRPDIGEYGVDKGYPESCKYGAGFAASNGSVIDLSAYEGSTVDVQLVATTNFGKQVVIANVINIRIYECEHTEKVERWLAPTTLQEGLEAHFACVKCGKAFDAEGNEIDPETIPVLAPTTNQFWGYEEMKNWNISGASFDLDNDGIRETPSKWKPTNPAADRTYVRFETDGKAGDGNLGFMSSNKDVTGQYLVIKYRTNHSSSVQIWANTKENGHSGGQASFYCSNLATDGKWYVLILDIAAEMEKAGKSQYVQPNGNGEYIIQWARIDALDKDTNDAGKYFDIAYIALADDLSKVDSLPTFPQ